MSFLTPLDDHKHRTFAGKRLKGVVVKNDDSDDKNEDHQKMQRIKVRIPKLHDKLKDEELPYFSPGNLPSYSGSPEIGDHGPIPPVGTQVWVKFEDESQYYGQYLGAVQSKKTKIKEFTDKKGKYHDSYQQAFGSVDASGSLTAVDAKRDTREWSHVSNTSVEVDGKGNTNVVINGDTKREDNKDAAELFSKGLTLTVFGGKNIYVSGGATIQVGGDCSIQAKGNATVHAGKDANVKAKGKVLVQAGSDCDVSSKGTMNLSASTAIKLDAPSITSKVLITLGDGKSPADPNAPDFEEKKKPDARKRPQLEKPEQPKQQNSSSSTSSGMI